MTIKKNTLIGLVVVIAIVLAGVFLYNKSNKEKDYSVVYLSTGEVYVGKLKIGSDLILKNGYILQVTKDPTDSTKNNFQLNPIKDALWAPREIHFIKDQVVFYGPLLSTSKIAETLAIQK
jgi:hypothetical protein